MRDKLTYKQYAEGGFITNEKLTEDQYNFLTRELDYERKPYNQTDVYSSVTLKDLPEDTGILCATLEILQIIKFGNQHEHALNVNKHKEEIGPQ